MNELFEMIYMLPSEGMSEYGLGAILSVGRSLSQFIRPKYAIELTKCKYITDMIRHKLRKI